MCRPSLGRLPMLLQPMELLELALFFKLADLDFRWRGNRKQERHKWSGLVRGRDLCHPCQWAGGSQREERTHQQRRAGMVLANRQQRQTLWNTHQRALATVRRAERRGCVIGGLLGGGGVSFKRQLPLLISSLPTLQMVSVGTQKKQYMIISHLHLDFS